MAKIEKADNSPTTTVRLESGPEVFTANDPLELTNQLANSLEEKQKVIVSLRGQAAEAEEWKSKYEATIQAQQAATQASADPNVAYWKNLSADAVAQSLGYANAAEHRLEEERKREQLEYRNWKDVVTEFDAKHPEFNGANGAAEKLVDDAFEAYGLSRFYKGFDEFARKDPKTAATILDRELAAKYYTGEWKPMTPEEQAIANGHKTQQVQRGTAPPMLSGSNPEQSGGQQEPWNMPLDELRKQAIQQELNRK